MLVEQSRNLQIINSMYRIKQLELTELADQKFVSEQEGSTPSYGEGSPL